MAASVATRVGDKVPDSFRGRAFVVHRDACYLRDEDGQQLVLLDDGTPPAPHGINVVIDTDDFREIVARDSRAQLQNGVLTITGAMDTRAAFSLGDATLYEGRLCEQELAPDREVAAALGQVEAAIECSSREGLDGRLCRAARRRIRTNIDRLATATATGDQCRQQLLAAGLIGFGQAEASGDAALVGFLAARTVLGKTDAGIVAAIAHAAGREVDPSWGFLEAAVQGHFCEPVRSLAESVAGGGADEAFRNAGRCLGSQEGWGPDLLVGLLGGFSAEMRSAMARASEA